MNDSGDNRLSRQRHYHRPGGLNGRVRNGNGCDPASMVAGKALDRRSSSVEHSGSEGWPHTSGNRHDLSTDPNLTLSLSNRRAVPRVRGCSEPIGVVKLLGC